MFVFINGELLNLDGITAVTPAIDGPGCVVQFVGGGARFYTEHGPECFAQAAISGDVVHFMDVENHEC